MGIYSYFLFDENIFFIDIVISFSHYFLIFVL